MPAPHAPTQNHLLATLPPAEFDRLSPRLELVPMPLGEALYESGGRLQHVHFPTTSVVSPLYVREDGASAEIAVVGNESILGIYWKRPYVSATPWSNGNLIACSLTFHEVILSVSSVTPRIESYHSWLSERSRL